MIELFFCTTAASGITTLRYSMGLVCRERWLQERDLRFRTLTPATLGCSPSEFQHERRIAADSLATNPIYILADDDCLLPAKSPVREALSILTESPEFGILSLMPSNANIVQWTPENYMPVVTGDVMEHISVGGIRFCRKGAVKEWPVPEGPGYDGLHGSAIRRSGLRVGYFQNLKMNHLGEGYSTVWSR